MSGKSSPSVLIRNGQTDCHAPLHLIVARNVRTREIVKFFIAEASQDTPLTVLLHVAASRAGAWSGA